MMDALFGAPAPWFTAPALLGTGFLLVQLLMGEIGGDMDVDVEFDVDASTEAVQLDDPTGDARWLSLQSIAAFLVGFGWMGLASLRLLDLSFGISAIIGAAGGFAVAWMVVKLIQMLMRMESDANVTLAEAVGLSGDVHVMIPPRGGGSGRVAIVINQSRHEFNAVQEGEAPIASHTRVRVVKASAASGSLTVEVT